MMHAIFTATKTWSVANHSLKYSHRHSPKAYQRPPETQSPILQPSRTHESSSSSLSSSSTTQNTPASLRSIVPRALAPWTLHGRCYTFPLYSNPLTSTVYTNSTPELPFVGGIGGLIFADYTDSVVGPYKELVYVPGAYRYRDASGAMKTSRSVSRIWVDNEASKLNGRLNWGFLKELAEFEWQSNSGHTRIIVRKPPGSSSTGREEPVLDVLIKDHDAFPIPVQSHIPLLNLNLLEYFPLVQAPLDENVDNPYLLKTVASFEGWAKPASLQCFASDPSLLPPFESLYGASVPSFETTFHKPTKVRQVF